MYGFSHGYHRRRYCSWARTHDGGDGGVAQHGGHTPNNRLTETSNLGLPCTSLILDIPLMIKWDLSKQGICWPVSRDHIAGSSLQPIVVACFFEVDRWPSAGFSIASWAHVRLTCWKQGRIVWNPVNASPGLKFIWIITFFHKSVFSLLCFVYMVIIKLKTEGQTGTENLITKLKAKFYLSNGHLNRALNNPAKELRF